MKHETKNIIIKQADVDIGIIPTINWLNSIYDTITLFCCQGNDQIAYKPYVKFITNSIDWSRIQSSCKDFAEFKVHNNDSYPMVVSIYFHNEKSLKEFQKDLSNGRRL